MQRFTRVSASSSCSCSSPVRGTILQQPWTPPGRSTRAQDEAVWRRQWRSSISSPPGEHAAPSEAASWQGAAACPLRGAEPRQAAGRALLRAGSQRGGRQPGAGLPGRPSEPHGSAACARRPAKPRLPQQRSWKPSQVQLQAASRGLESLANSAGGSKQPEIPQTGAGKCCSRAASLPLSFWQPHLSPVPTVRPSESALRCDVRCPGQW